MPKRKLKAKDTSTSVSQRSITHFFGKCSEPAKRKTCDDSKDDLAAGTQNVRESSSASEATTFPVATPGQNILIQQKTSDGKIVSFFARFDGSSVTDVGPNADIGDLAPCEPLPSSATLEATDGSVEGDTSSSERSDSFGKLAADQVADKLTSFSAAVTDTDARPTGFVSEGTIAEPMLDGYDADVNTDCATSGDDVNPAADHVMAILNAFEECGQSKGRKRYRCKICLQFPNLIALHVYNNTNKGYARSEGLQKRFRDMKIHLASELHKACMKALKLKSMTAGEKSACVPLVQQISAAQKELSATVMRYLPTVYNDAKRGTLSAWSYPSRIVASDMGQRASLDSFTPYNPPKSLVYCNPAAHREFLHAIVYTDLTDLRDLIRTALAVSIRVDGSVDKFQRDNKHVMAKVVTRTGDDRLYFLGFSRPTEKKTAGYVAAVKQATERAMRWDEIFPMVSSITTDGESLNTGEHTSLWASLRAERAASTHKLEASTPLLTIWCAAHRSNLAFESLENESTEVHRVITDATALATFFHSSGTRTGELEKLAVENGYNVRRLPKYFEVRFAQFTESLLETILISWRALVKYMKDSDDTSKAARKGFLKNLTDLNRLRLLCFLADILVVFSRYQKLLQSNSLTLFDLQKHTNNVTETLNRLLYEPLFGGWEKRLQSELQQEDGCTKLHGIELWEKEGRSAKRHRYAPQIRSFATIRPDIVASLCSYVSGRMSVDTPVLAAIAPLQKLDKNASGSALERCHKCIVPDFDMREFGLAYYDLARQTEGMNLTSRDILKLALKEPETLPVAVAMARIVAAVPHSCDVERLISAYGRLKSEDRSTLSPDHIAEYLHVQINMPTLANFDFRPTLKYWLADKKRQPRDAPSKSNAFFVGVFDEATDKAAQKNSLCTVQF